MGLHIYFSWKEAHEALELVAVTNLICVSLWPKKKPLIIGLKLNISHSHFSKHRDAVGKSVLCRNFCYKEPCTLQNGPLCCTSVLLFHFCESLLVSASHTVVCFSFPISADKCFQYRLLHYFTAQSLVYLSITDCTWMRPLQKAQELALFPAGFESRAQIGCSITFGLT